MPQTAKQIDHLLALLGRAPAPSLTLLPGDRQRLGGLLLPCGPALVRCVAAALEEDPAAFAALPQLAPALRARQDEADAWRRLRAALLLLAERAADQAIACEADALRTALAILDEVRAEPQRGPAAERALRRRRKQALLPADLLLRSYRQKVARPRPPRLEPPPPSRRTSATAGRRASAEIDRVFRQHLISAADAARSAPAARTMASPAPSLPALAATGAADAPRSAPLPAPASPRAGAPAFFSDRSRVRLDAPGRGAETTPAARSAPSGPGIPPGPAPLPTPRGGRPPMDARERFAADVTGEAAAPPPGTPPPLDSLRQQKNIVTEQYAKSPDPGFDAPLRQRLQSRGSTLWPELLRLAAQGVRDSAGFASRHDLPAEVCDETVAQDAAVARVIKGAGDLHGAATAAAAAVSRQGRGRALTVLQAAVGVINDPSDPAATQAELAFAEAFRLYEEGAPGGTTALRRERRLRPLREALERTRGEAAELRLLDRYLAETAGKEGNHE